MTERIILSFFAAAAALLHADTLILKNGTTIEGSFVGGNSHSIRFAVGERVNSYSIDDIDSIRFTNAAPSSSPNARFVPAAPSAASNSCAHGEDCTPTPGVTQPFPGPAGPPSPPVPPTTTATAYPPAPPAPPAAPQAPMAPAAPATNAAAQVPAAPSSATSSVEVPSGTQIVVRLIDPVNSERDRLGQNYRASIDQPVVVNGQTVIPRGADATAVLTDLKQSGKIEGRTVLTLDLKTISVNGKGYDIVTTGVPEASKSRGARSAKVIGGAAALGAIIGGAAGGGAGAAIGAGAGAAAGTAAEVMTSGQKVKIPAETRLTFTLQNPLDI